MPYCRRAGSQEISEVGFVGGGVVEANLVSEETPEETSVIHEAQNQKDIHGAIETISNIQFWGSRA
jgi:hypothetical protein